jgi:nicotinic acid phosphoribosyltransferase
MGGGVLQKCNRDTLRFAMKCSAAEIDGAWTDVQKRPATDLSKASKAGRLSLVASETGAFETVRTDQLGGRADLLKPVFRDGDPRRSELRRGPGAGAQLGLSRPPRLSVPLGRPRDSAPHQPALSQ